MPEDRVVVENVNHPGRTSTVRADKYHDMRRALLAALPTEGPGLTQVELLDAVQPGSRSGAGGGGVSPELFPEGRTSGWWMKCVQLDLEAKGLVVRNAGARPLRWRRVD